MSHRIAINEDVAKRSAIGFDFVVGRDGDALACVRDSWAHGPIAIWFDTAANLSVFLRAWEAVRKREDIWRLWQVQEDGRGELVQVYPKPEIDEAVRRAIADR